MGPLVDAATRDKVSDLVSDAVDRGATVRCGGERVGERGYFYAPTVLTDVPDGSRLLAEEVFGPVAPVVTFDDDDQAVAMANDTEFGLVAYVFTQRLDRALSVVERLDTGMVGLNAGVVSNPAAPFGGVKHSRLRTRGRRRGHRGVPGDQVRGHQHLTCLPPTQAAGAGDRTGHPLVRGGTQRGPSGRESGRAPTASRSDLLDPYRSGVPRDARTGGGQEVWTLEYRLWTTEPKYGPHMTSLMPR